MSANGNGRPDLPYSDDAELSVLGSLLIAPDRLGEVSEILPRSDEFHSQHAQRLYGTMLDVGADLTLIGERLKAAGEWDDDTARYAKAAGDAVPSARHAVHYAKIVATKARQRDLILRAARLDQIARDSRTADSDPEAWHADVERALRAAAALNGTAPRLTYPAITAAELASTRYAITYLIPGMLAEHQPGSIIGPKKALKTSLLLDVAIALSTAGCFLGRFRVPESRRVLVMSGESGMAVIQETCFRICDAAGCRLEDTGIIFSDKLPMFGHPEHHHALRKYLADHAIQVAFFDPLYRCIETGGREGSIFAMGKPLGDMADICCEAGVTPILAHHSKSTRPDPYTPGDLDDASWAGVAEFSRQWMVLTRREQYEPGTGFHRLWLSVGGSAGHSSLWGVDVNEGPYSSLAPRTWEVEVKTADEVRGTASEQAQAVKAQREEQQLKQDQAAVVKVLMSVGPATKTDLKARAGINTARLNAALAGMLDDGDLTECRIKKHTREETHYALSNGGDWVCPGLPGQGARTSCPAMHGW
ncbi:MAG: crosslink repair DNA glycosylase YcaQ family protein [Pirellulales bacterium]